MSANHISDDILIDALYGVSDAIVDKHIDACETCAARWDQLQEKRGAMAAPVNASAAILAEQRKKVFGRIENPPLADRLSRWAAPVLAGVAACVLAVGVLVQNPASSTDSVRPAATSAEQAANPAAGDAQVFSDAYAMEQSFEPSASASLGVLFERPEGGAQDPEAGRLEQQ